MISMSILKPTHESLKTSVFPFESFNTRIRGGNESEDRTLDGFIYVNIW